MSWHHSCSDRGDRTAAEFGFDFQPQPGPITANFDFGQKRMELTAKREFKAGEQVSRA